MELIDQHTKKIMEGCKERARDAGLVFTDESLEYIVSNEDLLELTPKGMIPTLYDYWVHDLEVIKSKKEYELYPHNPYETVVNTRPPLSFYNNNNPDWLNVMIFYHVLGHIDFMQNNAGYRHTWGDDFTGRALADKRLLAELRTHHGRWVDYVVEFTRGIDNIVGYYEELSALDASRKPPDHVSFFFDVFLQKVKKVDVPEYLREIDHYNDLRAIHGAEVDTVFIAEVKNKYPEFDPCYEKSVEEASPKPKDLLEFIMENSDFLKRDENKWMKSVAQVTRDTALYFAPQIRTKILNEGWATYWHNQLFPLDDRVNGHEVEFAVINAKVAAVPRVGFNPYAIGWRLFEYVEELADKGKLTYDFEKIQDAETRKKFDSRTGAGKRFLFHIRESLTDFLFVNSFIDQDFCDRHNLVLIGERINAERRTREYYIKSKKAEDYKQMLIEHLVHPPKITVDTEQTEAEGALCLVHEYEGRQLVPEFIDNVMIGLEYLWGSPVELITHLIVKGKPKKVRYLAKDRKVKREYVTGD